MSCSTCLETSGHRDGCPEAPQQEPVECDGTCNCSGDGPCRWYESEQRCGYVVGRGYVSGIGENEDIEPCRRCEGEGSYIPEWAEYDPT